jgi:phosphatidylserine/phosphatidylglycerophosphate/cardiolipin synthase-like enzyme
MRRALRAFAIGVAAASLFVALSASRPRLAHAADGITLCFTPEYEGGPRCTDIIVGAINSAQSVILVQAYFLTARPITKALVKAYQRGVKVQVILDRRNALRIGNSEAIYLARSGIVPLLDGMHKNAHNKIMIIDNQTVITGSFNFTYSAEHFDAENVLVITDPALARAYIENFALHAKHSAPYM